MRRVIFGAALVLVVVVVLALRGSVSPPTAEPEQVERVGVTGLAWADVVLADGVDRPEHVAADSRHAVFARRAPDGAWRLGSRAVGGGPVADVVLGRAAPAPLKFELIGGGLVAHQTSGDGVDVFAADVAGGARPVATARFATGSFAAAGGVLAVQEGENCLTFLDAADLGRRGQRCPDAGWTTSLLTGEADAVQWRETTPGQECAVWYRLGADATPERVPSGPDACRSALLVRADDWELTAAFPPYEVGVAFPGPLTARQGDRVLTLDTSVLNVHRCGGHVYWLSNPGNTDRRGELARWTPGETTVEVLGDVTGATPPRCVNGVLNVLFHGVDGVPRLRTLANP
ncbi:hypothetical protein [Saccharothrix obliqua]|uniref:hypothetical protein n=1 Tax=Saccharothrix obliqua TaxID=2861747 RepID=UPI001C5FE641|nr:hypothetical protein [Saccharothrix obliqua]MBW4721896.1 hypothetical protein [Saccharothrix obliqua]